MSNHRAYQTNPVISNILMRKTCSKTNKTARLTTIKQHFASHNIKHGYLKINLFASAPQPPPKILAASPLPTGHTVPSPHPSPHQGYAVRSWAPERVASLDPVRHTIHGRGTRTARFPAGPTSKRGSGGKLDFKRKEFWWAAG